MLEHLLRTFADARVEEKPFPHIYLQNVFPDEVYQEILNSFPSQETLRVSYRQRKSLSLNPEGLSQLPFTEMIFWTRLVETLISPPFRSALLHLFGLTRDDLYPDLSLVSDSSGYAIGPHTDHPQKVLTYLFYLPTDESQKELGTALYEPIDPQFRCEGFKHHSFEGFRKVKAAPFLPNSVFGFLKSDRSFHGVEPIQETRPRNSLSYQFLIP